MHIRSVVLMTALVVDTAAAQLSYSHTTFVHGFGNDGSIWLRNNTIGSLDAVIDLRSVATPTLGAYGGAGGVLPLDTMARELAFYTLLPGGSHVVVGHSLGGMVARRAALFYAPQNVSAILTIASPHDGAPIANNGMQAINYISATIAAVIGGASGGVLGYRNGVKLSAHVNSYLTPYLRDYYGAILQTPAVQDARVGSTRVLENVSSGDAFPHANVYGRIGERHAAVRTAMSAANNDAGFAWYLLGFNSLRWLLHKCTVIGTMTIVGYTRGRSCRRAYHAMGFFDQGWQDYAAGGEYAFDGLIPNFRQAYPGTALSDGFTNLFVNDVNHNEILYKSSGVNMIARAMESRLTMLPR